ncbi:IQ domain-containing protein D [Patagioenas fasciata monilis]|uniref:Dynein regulatory complex protein 10 n=1 Tax=Patagioenas fasciata monilis TaxID=372326 RepID=A0A1V4JSL6_PATFA|nr:IQ domain-containing protein D [Patagioenas fasciata monilis]
MATGDPDVCRVSSQDGKQRNKPLVEDTAAPEKAMSTSNATRTLDPRQLKPNSIETERITTVLDETIAKLELSSLIQHIINSLDIFADTLGPEITNKLIQHQKLSNEIEHLLASSEEGDTVRAEEQRGCLCLLEQHFSRSVRDILRLLLASPSLCRALEQESWVRESPAEEFIKAFGEFRNLMLERLLTSPKEEEERIQFMQDISLRIKKTSETVRGLEAEVAAAMQTREEEIDKRVNMVQDLKTSMQDLTEDSKANIQQTEQEGKRQQEEELEAFQARSARLEEEAQELEAQVDALIVEHRASELALRKRICRAEMEIANWVHKYDADMAEKQAEYEEVEAAYNEEKAQLACLTEKRDLLLQEYSQIQEERRRLKEKEEEALKELNIKTRAATCIQAYWKGYLVRSLYSSKKKKKKGKGKGKGKKTKK